MSPALAAAMMPACDTSESVSVDLPWSTCAILEKGRFASTGGGGGGGAANKTRGLWPYNTHVADVPLLVHETSKLVNGKIHHFPARKTKKIAPSNHKNNETKTRKKM